MVVFGHKNIKIVSPLVCMHAIPRMSYVSDFVSRLGREQYLSRRKEHGEYERRRRRAGPKIQNQTQTNKKIMN